MHNKINFYFIFRTDSSPLPIHVLYGNLYIGGVPRTFKIKKGTVGSNQSFVGCIGDTTLNDDVINFANSSHTGVMLGKCMLDIKIGSETDVHTGN